MADFFDDIGENIARGVNVLTNKTGMIVDKLTDKTEEMTDKGRNKWEESKIQRERKDLIIELGEMFYAMVKDNALNTNRLQAKCDEIAELDRKIAELNVSDGPNLK